MSTCFEETVAQWCKEGIALFAKITRTNQGSKSIQLLFFARNLLPNNLLFFMSVRICVLIVVTPNINQTTLNMYRIMKSSDKFYLEVVFSCCLPMKWHRSA